MFGKAPRRRGSPTRGGGLKSLLACAGSVAVAALTAGCGGSDGDSSDKASDPAKVQAGQKVELPSGRIAFRRYLDEAQTHGAIFTINPDGSDEKQLTDPPEGVEDNQPDWSPDGKRIAFERCSENEPCRTYIVAAGGGEPENVRARCTMKPICDLASPAWTPDGKLLLNLSQGREREVGGELQIQHSSLVLLDLEHGTQKEIIHRAGWRGDTHTPALSPDGRTIAYTRWNSQLTKSPSVSLFAVKIDGSGNRPLAPAKLGGGDHAVFSPDGRILFRSYDGDESKQSDFWTVRSDGAGLKQLTHHKDGTLVLSASYSHDGEWIVHATDGVGDNADIFVMRADGTGNRAVTRTESWDSAPDWGPAGS